MNKSERRKTIDAPLSADLIQITLWFIFCTSLILWLFFDWSLKIPIISGGLIGITYLACFFGPGWILSKDD